MTLSIETNCPIPQTHNRLRQTHDLWHEVLDAYADVDEFVLRLNSCIQAARSVTFLLQRELRKHDWFEHWYTQWQHLMRGDPRMRWLVTARNKIEKEGDLDTASVALVSVAATDSEQYVERFKINPTKTAAEIAEMITLPTLPGRIRRQAVMIVERRWTVPELPNDELLDVLGYCYGKLVSLLTNAHERCGVTMSIFGGEAHDKRYERKIHPSGRLSCMLPTAQARTAYWHLGDEAPMSNMFADPLSPAALRETERKAKDLRRTRYAEVFEREPPPPLAEHPTVEEYATRFHDIGKKLLAVDRYHQTIAWTFRHDQWIGQCVIDPEDQQDKIVNVRLLASEVDKTGADAIIITSEAWFAEAVNRLDLRFGLRAAERRDRQEQLLTLLLKRSGDHREIATFFSRSAVDGSIAFGHAYSIPKNGDHVHLYAPILQVWERWDTFSHSPRDEPTERMPGTT
jgi:hypothetical protein